MAQLRLTGLIAAPFTAMNEDGSVNLKTIEKQAKLLTNNGVKGAFICGTTGEGTSLTIEERMKIAERWQEAARDDLIVIVHAGHNCVSDSKKLAAHAQEIGADAVAAMAPVFFKPTNVEDLASFCAEVAAEAPGLPFYYYHIPGMTGVDLPMADFLKAAADKIPTLTGVKFSYNDLMDFSLCVNLDNGRFNMLFGSDEILVSAQGADGAVGSTYNYAAPLYHLLIDAYEAGDVDAARMEQIRAQEMVSFLFKYGGLSTGKAIMKIIGLDCGGVRSPLRDLSKQQYDELADGLKRIGFFDYCSKI
ncbi:dihydrodipicolinate synthase family protein [Candidatus Poribacteria bacterium]